MDTIIKVMHINTIYQLKMQCYKINFSTKHECVCHNYVVQLNKHLTQSNNSWMETGC